MKVAYVHVLPLEYYPPSTNLLALMSARQSWNVRAWTTANKRGMPDWKGDGVEIRRIAHPGPGVPLPLRMPGYLAWHLRTAREIAKWKPDVIMSVEPHSALATWMYFRVFRGRAPLFIHHYEYYAPEDFAAPGMRVLRRTMRLERNHLFPRAAWVSQTNAERLRMLRSWNAGVSDDAAAVLPNYPPAKWVSNARGIPAAAASARTRLVYVGSASFDDAFIGEICLWAAERRDTVSLHLCGNNVAPAVWKWIDSLGAANITTDPTGVPYDELPALLRQFDVGLVLYKGNTLNFVHNVPNKAIEYLACELEVWYPRQMEAMRSFHWEHPGLRMREMNFSALPGTASKAPVFVDKSNFPFTAQRVTATLLERMEAAARAER